MIGSAGLSVALGPVSPTRSRTACWPCWRPCTAISSRSVEMRKFLCIETCRPRWMQGVSPTRSRTACWPCWRPCTAISSRSVEMRKFLCIEWRPPTNRRGATSGTPGSGVAKLLACSDPGLALYPTRTCMYRTAVETSDQPPRSDVRHPGLRRGQAARLFRSGIGIVPAAQSVRAAYGQTGRLAMSVASHRSPDHLLRVSGRTTSGEIPPARRPIRSSSVRPNWAARYVGGQPQIARSLAAGVGDLWPCVQQRSGCRGCW